MLSSQTFLIGLKQWKALDIEAGMPWVGEEASEEFFTAKPEPRSTGWAEF